MDNTIPYSLKLLMALSSSWIIIALILILIEAFVIRFFMASSWVKAFIASLFMNIISWFAILLLLIYISRRQYEGPIKEDIGAIIFVALIILYSVFYSFRYRSYYVPSISAICVILGAMAFYAFFLASESASHHGVADPGCFTIFLEIVAYFASGFGVIMSIEIWVARMFYQKVGIDIAVLYANLYSLLALVFISVGYVLLEPYIF